MNIGQVSLYVSLIIGTATIVGLLFKVFGYVKNIDSLDKRLIDMYKETRNNTTMNKALCEVVEALADHAITHQDANGKVHRGLEVMQQIKYKDL